MGFDEESGVALCAAAPQGEGQTLAAVTSHLATMPGLRVLVLHTSSAGEECGGCAYAAYGKWPQREFWDRQLASNSRKKDDQCYARTVYDARRPEKNRWLLCLHSFHKTAAEKSW